MEANPALRAQSLERMGDLERTLAEALAAALRASTSTPTSGRSSSPARSCTAMRVAIDRWGATGGHGDLTEMVERALDLLDGGLDHSI